MTTIELVAKEACYHFNWSTHDLVLQYLAKQLTRQRSMMDGFAKVIEFSMIFYDKLEMVLLKARQYIATTASAKKNSAISRQKILSLLITGNSFLVYPTLLKIEDVVISCYESGTVL